MRDYSGVPQAPAAWGEALPGLLCCVQQGPERAAWHWRRSAAVPGRMEAVAWRCHDPGACMSWIGVAIRVLGVVTAVYAIWDAVLVASGRHLIQGSQLAWLIVAAVWALWGVLIIWPRRF